MPMASSRRSTRPVGIALAIGVASFAAVALFAVGSATAWRRTGARVEAVHRLLDLTSEIDHELLLIRVEHRSYLLTGQASLLDNVRAREARTDRALGDLAMLAGGDAARAVRVDSLRRTSQWMTGLRERVVAARARDLAAAVTLLNSAEAEAAREAIARQLRSLEILGHEELTALYRRADRTGILSLVGIGLALLLGAGFGIWALRAARAETRGVLASEARYRTLTDDNPDPIWLLRDGRMAYANHAAAALFQVPGPETLVGRPILDLVHPEDRAEVEARVARVVAGQPTMPAATRYLRADGTSVEAEARGAPVELAGERLVQVTARDLTARRQAELELALSEARFRAVVNGMAEGVVLQDASGTVQLWNPAAERILGLTGDQLAGRSPVGPAWRILDEAGAPLPRERQPVMVALRTGAPVGGVMGVERGTGGRAWIEVHAVPLFRPGQTSPYAATVTFADITEMREATRQLQASEARYRLLAEHSADLVSRRTPDNRFEYASPSHAAVLGWTPEDLLGRSGFELVHPDDLERLRAGPAQRVAEGQPSSPFALRVRHRDGHYVWLESVVTPVRGGAGEPLGHVVTARDITGRRALEEELARSRRMEAMGRMAAGVAHDLNNLLTVIRAAAELLATADPGPAARAEMGADIAAAVERAGLLTARLLAFARRQHAEAAIVRPADLVARLEPRLRRILGAGTQLELTVTGGAESAVIRADPAQLEMVLLDLVANARDAVRDGGLVRVGTGTVSWTAPRTHRYGTILPGEYLAFTVEDTGTGMSAETLEHLFEPFFTTKPEGAGTGLGLSSIYGVVHQAGGDVTVESTPGEGSRFTVYWPRWIEPPLPGLVATHPAAAAAQRRGPAPGAESARGTVLLVDDEEVVRRSVARLLRHAGFEVTLAAGGAEALHLLDADGTLPRVVITDVRMPGMTGVELAETMLRRGLDLPVLFISGQLNAPMPEDWPATARHAFLRKPFSYEELLGRLDRLLGPPD